MTAKKSGSILLVLCLFFTLLLGGCGSAGTDASGETKEVLSADGGYSDASDGQSAEDGDASVRQSSESSGLYSNPGIPGSGEITAALDDFQIGTCALGLYELSRVVQFGENGVYFGVGRLYYAEGSPLLTTILCAKPECTHEDESCNAYVGHDFQVYGGYIYYLGYINSNRGLYRCALSGGEQEQVMPFRCDEGGGSSMDFLIHRGFVIFASDYGSVRIARLGDSLETALTLFEVTEEESEEWHETTLTTVNSSDPYCWQFWAEGDFIYFYNSPGWPVGGSGYSTAHSNELYRYDITAGICELVWTLPDAADVGSWTKESVCTNGCAIIGGQMYFYLSENGLWRQDLDTGELVKLTDSPKEGQIGSAFFDEETAYISTCDEETEAMLTYIAGGDTEEPAIYCYDLATGTLKNTISLENLYEELNLGNLMIYGSDGEKLIVQIKSEVTYVYKGNGASIGSWNTYFYSIDAVTGEAAMLCKW